MFRWLQIKQNLANYEAHFEGTGPEIFRQTNGNVTAFVSGAGTSIPSVISDGLEFGIDRGDSRHRRDNSGSWKLP